MRRRRSFPRFHMPTVRYRRRRHDPAFLGLGGGSTSNFNFWRAVLQGPVTTVGGIFHNWLVRKYPSVAGGFKIGNGALGYAGLAGAAAGVALDLQSPPSMFGHIANSFGSGMLSEAVNVPMTEGVATIPTQRAYSGGTKQAALAPYVVNPMPTMGQGIF